MNSRKLTDLLAQRYRSTAHKRAYEWAIGAVFRTTPETGFADPLVDADADSTVHSLEQMENLVRLYGVSQALRREGFSVVPAMEPGSHAGLWVHDVADEALDLVTEILPAGTTVDNTTLAQRASGMVLVNEDRAFLDRLWGTVHTEVQNACKRAGRLADVFEYGGRSCGAEASDEMLFDWIDSLEQAGLSMTEARAALVDFTAMRAREDLQQDEFLLCEKNARYQGHARAAPERLKGHGWSDSCATPTV